MTTKKPGTGNDVLVFDVAEASTKSAPKQKTRRSSKGSVLPKLEMQKTRATYHFAEPRQGMQGYGMNTLRSNELKSIYALFAWVANEQGAAQETVVAMTETRFCVKDVTRLQQKDYDEVIKFLVDLRIDEMRH